MKKMHLLGVLLTAVSVASAEKKPDPVLEEMAGRTEAMVWLAPDGGEFRCRWHAPAKLEDGRSYPLVILMHGAGERGTNNVAQLKWGAKEIFDFLDARHEDFFFLAGQVPEGKRWVEVDWAQTAHDMPAEPSETMRRQIAFVEHVFSEQPIDRSRVYVTGISMGGYGTWDLLCRKPEWFAAAMPICGGADVKQADKVAQVPIWVYHGDRDTTVPFVRSRRMTAALWSCGGNVKYTEYPGVGHASWIPAYGTPENLKWLFSQRKPVDKGGLTFDFKAISAKRFAAGGGVKIPAEAWKGGYCYMHNGDIAGTDPRRKDVRKAVEFRTEEDESVIVKKPELVGICRGEDVAKCVSGGMSHTVKLPDAAGGTYRISAVYRMRHELGDFGGALVTPIRAKEGVPAGKSAPGDTAPQLEVCRFNNVWSEWVTWDKEFRIPAGCDALNVVMRIDGVGELRFKDVSVSRVVYDRPISLRSSPADWFDGTFAFSAGQCAMPSWQWKKNNSDDKYDISKFTFVLTLPKGYAFIESPASLPQDATSRTLADGGTEWRLPATRSYGGNHIGVAFNGWSPLTALVRAAADAGPGEMRFWAEYDGRRVSDEAVTKIFTIPAIKAPMPKRYANGFYLGGPYAQFRTTAAREGFAELFTSAGANWVVQMCPDPETRAIWRRRGVRYVTPEYYQVANGFRVGDAKRAPAEDRYVALPGGTHPELGRAMCPVSVYTESEFFRHDTLPKLKKYLEGCDGLWSNWEPYMFRGRGCMCDRCRAAFARYVGVSEEEMKKDWPQELAYGRKWYDKIRKFRSLEHAKLVKTIHRHVIEMTGGDSSLGFIPGIAWCEMSSAWRPANMAAEVQAIDYAGDLRWIDPWGPYPWWDASTPYVKSDAGFLGYFLAAKDVRAQVNADYGEKAPKLMSFPHGVQGSSAFTQPESIALSLDSFFFNGWESSVVYAFPKGYDARYWRAFAEATARAAKYEDYVFDGHRCDGAVKLELDASASYPPPAKKVYGEYLAYAKNVSHLQHVAYERNGRIAVAVFNFADSEPATFRMTVNGVAERTLRTVGASRCEVFEVRKR